MTYKISFDLFGTPTVVGIGFLIAIILCSTIGPFAGLSIAVAIVLHELAHVFVAKFFNIKTHLLEFSFNGGVAYMEKVLITGKDDLLISAAGPVMNFVLSAIAAAFLPFLSEGFLYDSILWFSLVNLLVAVYNSMPVCPLDGEKVLRSSLHLLGCKESVIKSVIRISSYTILFAIFMIAAYTSSLFFLLFALNLTFGLAIDRIRG